MSTSKREWTQLELKLMAGSEPWFLVRHRNGLFKLPGSAEVLEVVRGVQRGWDQSMRPRHSPGYVRVPMDEWLAHWAKRG